MRHILLLLAVLACLGGCTPQQMMAFDRAMYGFNSAVAAAQRERIVRAYEQQSYAPAPQTVVVIHRDER